jgi:hypothetical protein
MPNAATVQFNVKNFTPGVSVPTPAIFYVMGITKRGPIEQPDIEVSLVRSWPQFERLFGGLMDTSDFPYLCKRALARGAQLRVCRVDAASTAAVKATAINVTNTTTPVTLFSVQPKYKGANYNNITIATQAPSNGDSTNYFNMTITHALEDGLNESYENIPGFIIGTGGEANNQTCLDEVIAMSQLCNFTYADLSADADEAVPIAQSWGAFTGGVDPTGHINTDYSGALTSFDNVDDGLIMAIPEQDDDTLNAAGITWAAARKDLVFFAHLPNSLVTAATLVTERGTIASNSKYGALYCGGIRITEERTLQEKAMSEMGDVLGIAAYIHTTFGEWYSLAGQSKGAVQDAIGVVTNFGTPAGFADLNTLANAQINAMVQKNGIVQLSGNFSAQFENNQEKYLSVVMLVIWMKKTLKPILESYLEEPNDPITFQKIYYHLKPYLDRLASPAYRALYKYEYYGDQDAATIDDLQVNNPVDVQNGKYRIDLKIWPIPSLQELTFNLMLVQGEGVYIE